MTFLPTAVVIGSQGQLARALARTSSMPTHLMGRDVFGVLNKASLYEVFGSWRPSIVINTAAYTAVDAAETDVQAAYALNAHAAGDLADWAFEAGIPLLHVSTDYVFDGFKGLPYSETDATHPLNVYGASKRAGELRVLAAGGPAVIVRTSWLYGADGHNFVKTMMRLGQERSCLRVVHDQIGRPTYVDDLAYALWDIATRMLDGEHLPSILHASSEGQASWAEFAEAIFSLLSYDVRVERIATADYPTPARRPLDSRLDLGSLHGFGVRLPVWQSGLENCLRGMESGS